MSSLEEGDKAAGAVAVAPRVTLDDIKANITWEYFVNAADAVFHTNASGGESVSQGLHLMTLCFIVTKSGYVVVGKSAPASPENFNAELGHRFAKEDAMRQLWPLMGYALKERLMKGEGE